MKEFVQPDTPDPEEMTTQQTSRLLKIGLSGETRPVDELIDRLEQSDGAQWLSEILASHPLSAFALPRDSSDEHLPTVDQLVVIKEMSKKRLHRGGNAETRLSATASYFFSVGAALAYHKQIICSRDRNELDPILKDLAAVTPDPWSSMFERAVGTPRQA